MTAALPRRLAAIVYDLLLLVAVLFAATALVLPLTGGVAVGSGNPLFQLYLVAVSYLFFAISWTRGGQTLGMKAWKIKLVGPGPDGRVGWARAAARFALAALSWAAFGAGFWWSLIDRERLTWHDRGSDTRLLRVATL